MEESFSLSRILFNESDSIYYISNFENNLNICSEYIFLLI